MWDSIRVVVLGGETVPGDEGRCGGRMRGDRAVGPMQSDLESAAADVEERRRGRERRLSQVVDVAARESPPLMTFSAARCGQVDGRTAARTPRCARVEQR